MGEVYYYNKFSMKVITVHPMSDVYLDRIDEARQVCVPSTIRRNPHIAPQRPTVVSSHDPWMTRRLRRRSGCVSSGMETCGSMMTRPHGCASGSSRGASAPMVLREMISALIYPFPSATPPQR